MRKWTRSVLLLDQRLTDLAKALEDKDVALQRAEQKIVVIEGRLAEQK